MPVQTRASTPAGAGRRPGARARRAFEQLRGAGQRGTLARQLVLDALDETGGHLSATDIHARVARKAPSVTLSTVYRTLATLADYGLVHVLSHGGEARYGFADQPHHHSVCTECGRTRQIPPDAVVDLIPALERAGGLRLATDGITLTGTCPDCARKKPR